MCLDCEGNDRIWQKSNDLLLSWVKVNPDLIMHLSMYDRVRSCSDHFKIL